MFLDESKHAYLSLPRVGSWPRADHGFETESLWAINAAIASKRPLLVQGEPGTGKSQLARAAAAALGRVPLSFVVNARTESRDLQYHYDALARLAEAQTASLAQTSGTDRDQVLAALHPKHFLEPGILWWAFAWGDAEKQTADCRCKSPPPPIPEPAVLADGSSVPAKPENGIVVLIDEIDKADSDVPNGLLETLGNGGFSVPYINRAVIASEPFPLVVLTTNGDRELPAAFRRRCLVLNLAFQTAEKQFVKTLAERGQKRYGRQLAPDLYGKVAKMLWGDRQKALETQINGPGQAEYFDMLEALVSLKESNNTDPGTALQQIRKYIFQKHAAGNGP